MERWNWFLSANFLGKWIITTGYAEVACADNSIQATLKFPPDKNNEAINYAYIKATSDDDGMVHAIVKPVNVDTPSYIVNGHIYQDKFPSEDWVTSMILTDGHTVLCFAKGPRSNEDNLA